MSDDDLLKRYLLGDLSGDEEEALERRLLAEDDLFELAEALEVEVLEDYARGVLTPAQNARLARFLKASPDGRARLALVRGLARSSTPANVLPFARPARTVPAPPRLQAVSAIAAMLCLAAGAAWLASVQVPGPMMAKRAPALTTDLLPDTEGTPPQLPPDRPSPDIGGPAPDQVAASPAPPVAVSPSPSPVVFVATLALSSLRGEEEVTAVHIPTGTARVDLRLPLRSGDENYPSYRVTLTDGTGAEVVSREPLQIVRHGRSEPGLVLSVEAGQLPVGRYSLEIQGILASGEKEDLAFPEFEVREP